MLIEGYETYVYPRGSIERKQTVSFWIKAWQGLGGQAAGSSGAMKYLLKQVEELASNRDQQPVYIQWTASADPAALLNTTELHDGWYIIDDFEPDYSRNVVTGLVQCRMTVTQVAAAPPRSVALGYSGGALSSNYSGTALNLVSLPVGSTAQEASFTRTGGEGAIPGILSPAASPEPFTLSATISNWFKGGVHVYDTINTGSNAVPTAASGLFVNANWVEVFYADHDFVGDCVITNGLQLLLFQTATTNVFKAYLWNTAAANVGWQFYADGEYADNAVGRGTLESYSLIRVGPEECAIATVLFTGTNTARDVIRLQRGRYEGRIDISPLTQATTGKYAITLNEIPAVPKIAYNGGKISDNVLGDASPAVQTDYGYGAAFVASTTQPFIVGLLYQNQPGTAQPTNDTNSAYIAYGDTTSLAVNAQRSYGFFAVPYGTSGSFSTANLQAEAESGALGTGWSSIADAAASAGNTANLANGTLTGNADLWGTSFVPAPGVYDLWVRMKATTHTSATAQLQIGLWDATSTAFVASTTYAPNQVTGSYVWYRVAAAVTPTAAHNMQVRAVTTATTTDAWQIDESALVPHTLTTANTGPQDIFQQWLWDDSNRGWIRP